MNRLPLSTLLMAGIPALLIAGVLGLSGCDFTAAENAFNNFDVIISLDEVNSYVALKVVDGETQNFVPENVVVRFQGDNASKVIDMFSDPVDEMTISGGIGSFGLDNSLVPSTTEPVSIRVNVSAVGYQSNSATIALRSKGRTDGEVYLFRDNVGTAGAQTSTASGTTNGDGVLVGELSTQTPPNPTNQAEAGVLMPGGTQTMTATGTPAQGTLQTDIVYYTANTSSTAVAFPGGFETPVQGLDGTVSEVNLTTAGFMTVNVFDQEGNRVTRFDPPIELSMEIAPTTMNPVTGSPVVSGDEITFFSYNEDDGLWVEEGSATLSGPGSDGNFLATFLTPHLTTWSAGFTTNGCDSGTFTIDRNGNTGSIYARASSASAGWFGRTIVIPGGDSEFNIVNAPSSLTDFDIAFDLAGQTRTVHQDNSICGASDAVQFDPPTNITDVTFTLDLGPTCSALKVNDVPTLAIFYKLPGQTDAESVAVGSEPEFELDSLGRITGGQITIPGLKLGETYRFYTTINNERAERDIRIANSSLPFDISADVDQGDMCVRN